MNAVIFDIDGTLADITHRVLHIQKFPKDWDAFYEAMDNDKPIDSVCHLCTIYASISKMPRFNPVQLFFVTGRPEKYRKMTIKWLKETIPELCEEDIVNDEQFAQSNCELIMRKDGDHRQDYVVKKEVLEKIQSRGYQILFAVEDRKQCVDMYRKQGITCLQCAEGNF